ncbi:MAG: hypothetical protein PHH36_07315 [Sideroxydans sp.]|nr:hypothetical protein [Sideroxydans sp.]
MYWRAALAFGSDGNILQGRTYRIGRNKAVLSVDRNLPAGGRCKLILMPPKESIDGEVSKVYANAEIETSVLASDHFQITVRWLDMDEMSKRVLDEKISSASTK